jgi:hypothetical protein
MCSLVCFGVAGQLRSMARIVRTIAVTRGRKRPHHPISAPLRVAVFARGILFGLAFGGALIASCPAMAVTLLDVGKIRDEAFNLRVNVSEDEFCARRAYYEGRLNALEAKRPASAIGGHHDQ